MLFRSDSAAATLSETELALSTSGTLTVRDVDLSNTVSLSTSVVSSGTTTGIGPDNAALNAMLSLSAASLAANPSDTHNLTWTFNAGTDAFDYLAAGETLTLTYTITATDNANASTTQNVVITINGTNDAPTISLVTTAAVMDGDVEVSPAVVDSAAATLSETELEIGRAHV